MKKINKIILAVIFLFLLSGCEKSEIIKDTSAEHTVFKYETEDIDEFVREYIKFLSDKKSTGKDNEIRILDSISKEDLKIYRDMEELKKDFPDIDEIENWKIDTENFVVCLIMDVEYTAEIQKENVEFNHNGLESVLLSLHREGKTMILENIVRI